MSRVADYIGAVAILVVGVALIVLANKFGEPVEAPIEVPETASSSISVLPTLTLPPVTFPTLPSSATTTVATSTQTLKAPEPTVPTPPVKTAKTPSPEATSTVPVAKPVSAPAPLPSSGSLSLDAAALALRGALVNIMCYAPAGSAIHSILGSGVFIDSKGIILTNAHIAQYFLLVDKGVSCTIRTGSPATNAYKAALIYLSPAWIHANATILSQVQPTGTGEYDYALLAVTSSATATPLPAVFPYVPLAELAPANHSSVVIASFGAQFLDQSQIQSSLYPIVVFGSIKDVFTFGVNTVDDIALGGTVAAQEGSSGGGVVDVSGTLVGTITTSTVEGSTDTRSLSAITASYIRSQYSREMGGSSLDSLLFAPTADSVADFAPQIPLLESIVTANL
ncbi:MAG: serine protease [Minisyncoccia bacterium]